MSKPIAIFGAGGLGREILLLIRQINHVRPGQWQPIGFFDDGIEAGTQISGLPVLGNRETLNTYPEPLAVIIALGMPNTKKQIVASIQNPQVYFPMLIHPSIHILLEQDVCIGEGSIICEGVTLTTNITIGKHVLLSQHTTVGHDAFIDDYCSLMPAVNVSGTVTLNKGAYAGVASTFKQQISVGEFTTVGMNAAVIHSLPGHCTAVGVPAQVCKPQPPAPQMPSTFDIPLSAPDLSGIEYNLNYPNSTSDFVEWLQFQNQVFTNELMAATGTKHLAFTCSGSAALELVLAAIGITEGDEVLCQTLTFAASANAIRNRLATPIFIDSEPTTWNMCPEHLETALLNRLQQGKRPKAVIAVDIYGMPARWQELEAICEQYGVILIEDAAEALGSTDQRRVCGSFGRVAILSFNKNKIITTFGGGAVLSNNPELIHQIAYLNTQARVPAPHYLHHERGFNYQWNPMGSFIGQRQLQQLGSRVARRRNHFRFYQQTLGQLPGIGFQPEPIGYRSNRWLTAITIDSARNGLSRETVRLALARHGIESRPVFNPMHRQPVHEKSPFYGTGLADKLFREGLCLPSGSDLTTDQRQRVVDVIRQLFSTIL